LVVLTGVKAFHRSPSSTLSTETTSVSTLTPTDLLPRRPQSNMGSKAPLWLFSKEKPKGKPAQSHGSPRDRRKPRKAKVIPAWLSKELQNTGPKDRSLVMPCFHIQSERGQPL
jgi:hypothetical protein